MTKTKLPATKSKDLKRVIKKGKIAQKRTEPTQKDLDKIRAMEDAYLDGIAAGLINMNKDVVYLKQVTKFLIGVVALIVVVGMYLIYTK